MEDDDALLAALTFALSLEGFEVQDHCSAHSVSADELPQKVCLVIDDGLPGESGLSLLARLRTSEVLSPAIVITSHPNPITRRRVATLGATLIEKPVIGDALAHAREEEIYGQDEDAEYIYQVVKGAVRTTRLMSDGRQIGDFYYPNDVFGIEPDDLHLFSAEALADSVILVVKRSTLRGTATAELDRLVYTAARRELRRAQEHVRLLGRKTAREKSPPSC